VAARRRRCTEAPAVTPWRPDPLGATVTVDGVGFAVPAPAATAVEVCLFDTPDAPIRRTHAQSTFEVLVDRHRLDDAKVRWLARILHDIEINTWQRKALARTLQIEAGLWRLIEAPGDAGMVDRCVQWLDALEMSEEADADVGRWGNAVAPGSARR